jgi:hypothetical protein
MPPKLTDDGAKDIMLKYLQAQNRPYSAIDVFNNLHGEVGKSQVVKVLTTMAEEGLIIEKVLGKTSANCCGLCCDWSNGAAVRYLNLRKTCMQEYGKQKVYCALQVYMPRELH